MVVTSDATKPTTTPVVTVTTSSTPTMTTTTEHGLSISPTEVASIANVRLPSFWRYAPRQWFAHTDAMFHANRVRSDLTRVNYVLASLDDEGIREVSDLLGDNVSYDLVRERLVSLYTAPAAARFRSIIQPGDMGDRTPSRLLKDMRDVYPEGMSDAALEQFWRAKLPAAVRTVIAGFSGSLESLAERADRILFECESREVAEVRPTPRVRCAAVFPESREIEPTPEATPPARFQTTLETRVQTIESAILSLTEQVSQLASQIAPPKRAPVTRPVRSEPPPPQHAGNTTGWCYYHARYGPEAQKCRAPCTFVPTHKN
ncbi:uncharacterized protein LOC126552359 [Aphis gossypii]|uniref:uncharacterized protein LOC126552359 n=1 Tax=Aphis gossypii TaxID=80765 RepID=UPI0021595544|nr:uncharacterized protein LOC126552359 [Aphis gossypii]